MHERALRNLPDLWKEAYDLVAQVPEGMVTTYGEVAKSLGDVVASRFVGLAMSRNDDIVRVPCRRVVQSDGSLGGYTGGGPKKKARLLREEGVKISRNRVVDLDKILFKDFRTSYPLRELRHRQRLLRRYLRVCASEEPVDRVAGIDLAYDDDVAYAAMVLFDYQSGKEIDHRVVVRRVKFPYVPTYLAFRELPPLKDLLKGVDKKTVVMFDGNGILHPEGFGIASQLGVVYDLRSIGVAKKLLCGEVSANPRGEPSAVKISGKVMGHVLRTAGTIRPVYVSVGHGISPQQAIRITERFMAHRIPEPTRRAHIQSVAARNAGNQKYVLTDSTGQ